MSKNKLIEKIKREIIDISKSLNIHPSELPSGKFKSLSKLKISDWELRKLGGVRSIISAYFPVQEKDLSFIEETSELKNYIKKLEKKLGQKEAFEKAAFEAINKNIKPLPKIKSPKYKTKHTKIHREVVTMLNDTHYGLVVNPEEIGNLNSFAWKEASRRTAFVIKQAIEYKPHCREEVEKFHLILNGDIIAGIIHGLTSQKQDLIFYQVSGAIFILTHAIEALLKNYKEVEVTGVSGNHSDMPHKRENGNRVTSEKYDSFENMIYYGLSVAFRNNPRVNFNFPKTPYAFVNLPAGRAMVCHGDTLFSKALGNPGSTINVKSLSDSLQRFNVGEVAKGEKPIKLVLFGHVHTFAHFTTTDGIEVYIAPSLSGTDGFAHGIDINTNLTGQVVLESTQNHIIGDSRLIRVTEADKDSSLDSVIPVYNRSLKWED